MAMETDLRIMIIGPRWSGKSSTGNTILGRPLFECGPASSPQCEVRSGSAGGHSLTVVDVPGWSDIPMLKTSAANKQYFKLSWTKCLPGPHVFLLTIPLDKAFTKEQGQYVQEYLSLLGDRVWRHVVVLFTRWDYLDKKTTINDHIESEGEALKKILQKCDHRFHMFDNKKTKKTNKKFNKKTNPCQVQDLLSKIEKMIVKNAGQYYKADEKILQIITEKRQLAASKASQRRMEIATRREMQKQLLRELEKEEPIKELRVILLGSRYVGKSAVLNTILGDKDFDSGKKTTSSMVHEGYINQTLVKVVDTPGWLRSLNVKDTTEHVKQEIMRSVFLCPPGPHVFLLVIDTEASFTELQQDVVESHLRLLGENLWRYLIVVFSKGDWLREETIEEHIEVEGEALSCLINKCGNRYHILRNKSIDKGIQASELLQKMKELVAENKRDYFQCDENIFKIIEDKRRLVKQRSKEKKEAIQKQRVTPALLNEIRVVLLGQRKVGKTSSGNTILGQDVLHIFANLESLKATSHVSGRRMVVVDTPGWGKYREEWTLEQDKEIIRGLTLCSPGPHAFLLVLPADLSFSARKQKMLEEYMVLLGEDVWKHTLVLFTHGDQLRDQTIEEHIMMERPALLQLIERCGNRYHVFNNKSNSTSNQVLTLVEKIEEMVAINKGQHYIPDMAEIGQRVEEKFDKREISVCLEEKWKKREAEIYGEFKDYLSKLLRDLRDADVSEPLTSDMSAVSESAKQDLWSQAGREKIEEVKKSITEKIGNLETELQRSNFPGSKLNTSLDFLLPSMSGSQKTWSESGQRLKPSGNFKDVLAWLSNMEIEKEDPPTYSRTTSGIQSSLSDIFPDS